MGVGCAEGVGMQRRKGKEGGGERYRDNAVVLRLSSHRSVSGCDRMCCESDGPGTNEALQAQDKKRGGGADACANESDRKGRRRREE